VQHQLSFPSLLSGGPKSPLPEETLAQATCLAELGMVLEGDDEAYEAFSQPRLETFDVDP